MTLDEIVAWAKIACGMLVGGLLSMRNIPGNRWQKSGSFLMSIAIGTLIGLSAIEFFSLDFRSWQAALAVATATAFGYAVAINAMQQIPEWLQAARRRIFGS